MKELVEVSDFNAYLISRFLERAGNSLNSFRYFNTRSLSVIKNHLVTYILLVDGSPIAYGHLDKEGTTIWLGIAVIERERGKGFGSYLMRCLINKAKINDLKSIQLSVDESNREAQELYKAKGFIQFKKNDKTLFFNLEL